MATFFFTADEHYGHTSIIRHCKRPFASVDEMDAELIARHNAVVGNGDTVVHVGDFTLRNAEFAATIIRQLTGQHVFVRGSHDRWLPPHAISIWERAIEGHHVVACHYAMRVWPKSHDGAWQVYGHSHGNLPPIGKQWDVGVDTNDFRPVSFDELKAIMARVPERSQAERER